MTSTTRAQDFLCEVADLAGFIDGVLAMPRGSRWHWPSYYLFYAEVDRLQGLLVRTRWLFERPCPDLGEAPDAQEEADSANVLFTQLGKRQQAIVDWLTQMCLNTRTGTARSDSHIRLEAHFHPKSGWYQEFFAQYDAGALAPDGQSLLRTVLPILAEPPYERVDHVTANCMLRNQSFDASTPEARKALADATREAAQTLGGIAARMQATFLAHCRLEDLLHPCSA